MEKEHLTEEEIKRKYNTTKILKLGDFLQVQHHQTKEYHYFVWGTGLWRKLDITSLTFGSKKANSSWIGE